MHYIETLPTFEIHNTGTPTFYDYLSVWIRIIWQKYMTASNIPFQLAWPQPQLASPTQVDLISSWAKAATAFKFLPVFYSGTRMWNLFNPPSSPYPSNLKFCMWPMLTKIRESKGVATFIQTTFSLWTNFSIHFCPVLSERALDQYFKISFCLCVTYQVSCRKVYLFLRSISQNPSIPQKKFSTRNDSLEYSFSKTLNQD